MAQSFSFKLLTFFFFEGLSTDKGHGGVQTLATNGLKRLLRFVHSLIDRAQSVGAATQSATSGIPIHQPAGWPPPKVLLIWLFSFSTGWLGVRTESFFVPLSGQLKSSPCSFLPMSTIDWLAWSRKLVIGHRQGIPCSSSNKVYFYNLAGMQRMRSMIWTDPGAIALKEEKEDQIGLEGTPIAGKYTGTGDPLQIRESNSLLCHCADLFLNTVHIISTLMLHSSPSWRSILVFSRAYSLQTIQALLLGVLSVNLPKYSLSSKPYTMHSMKLLNEGRYSR